MVYSNKFCGLARDTLLSNRKTMKLTFDTLCVIIKCNILFKKESIPFACTTRLRIALKMVDKTKQVKRSANEISTRKFSIYK